MRLLSKNTTPTASRLLPLLPTLADERNPTRPSSARAAACQLPPAPSWMLASQPRRGEPLPQRIDQPRPTFSDEPGRGCVHAGDWVPAIRTRLCARRRLRRVCSPATACVVARPPVSPVWHAARGRRSTGIDVTLVDSLAVQARPWRRLSPSTPRAWSSPAPPCCTPPADLAAPCSLRCVRRTQNQSESPSAPNSF